MLLPKSKFPFSVDLVFFYFLNVFSLLSIQRLKYLFHILSLSLFTQFFLQYMFQKPFPRIPIICQFFKSFLIFIREHLLGIILVSDFYEDTIYHSKDFFFIEWTGAAIVSGYLVATADGKSEAISNAPRRFLAF